MNQDMYDLDKSLTETPVNSKPRRLRRLSEEASKFKFCLGNLGQPLLKNKQTAES